MSKSNIGEPFLLATYTSTIRGIHLLRKPGVYATVSQKLSSDDYVTVAVQADGVHILDVSSLHPVISHTTGPATSFACPPLTLRATSSVSTTYAVIAASSEFSSPDESGRVLWVWQDDSSLKSKEKQKLKRSKLVLPPNQTAHSLFSSTELPGRIVILSTTGELFLIDTDSLHIKSTSTTTELSSSSNATSVIQTFFLSSSQCSFFTLQNGAVLVVASSGPAKTTQLRIWTIDEGDSISDKRRYIIPVEADQICCLSCSPSGCLTILTADGLWRSYQLSASIEPEFLSAPPAQISPPLALAGLSFLLTPNSLTPIDRFSVSTLALTSSHVLLAGISLSQEIILLLWDLQFSVLLASHSLSIPFTLSSSLYIQLVLGPQTLTKTHAQVTGQALLILSSIPPSPGKDGGKATSVLFVVPYTVPSTATISSALGLGGASGKWLRGVDDQSSSVKPTAAEISRAKLLTTVRSAAEGGQGQAAAAAFIKWVSQDGDGESWDVDRDRKPANTLRLEYNFVKELLNIVLLLRMQPNLNLSAANASSAYSPEIIQYLLEKQVVCSAMVEAPGGLLGALRARDDWNSIELAFSAVLDLKESEIIESLHFNISQHRSSSTVPSDNAMQIDTPPSSATTIVPLPTFLNLSITYPTSRAPLVSAVRKQLRDAEDLTILLEILDKWLTQRTGMEEKLFPEKKDSKKTEYGIWTVVGSMAKNGGKRKLEEEVPTLDKIIDFIQIILDSSFLSLLQHKRAHQVLQRINTQLDPEIAFAKMTESLRGPLEPFAIAQEKKIKGSMVPEKEKEKEREKIDWRQRRKRFDGDVGVYQLEELVLY